MRKKFGRFGELNVNSTLSHKHWTLGFTWGYCKKKKREKFGGIIFALTLHLLVLRIHLGWQERPINKIFF